MNNGSDVNTENTVDTNTATAQAAVASTVSTEQTVVQTDVGNKDGQNKCPKCGSTDIMTNIKTGKLKCQFCRHEFEAKKVDGLVDDISQLSGEVIASGASNISADANDVVTFKCESCGAEVVVDTSNATSAKCHWCRSVLGVNQQIPNGSIPDIVLPFGITKEEAKVEIDKFVGKRKFFAFPKFKQEFTSENVMGVYLPYMLVDVNGHATFKGKAEHKTREYTVGSDEHKKTYYDADCYNVEREFDIIINGLSIESSADKLDKNNSTKTTNIINSIMPFDVENCVKYDANYLRGFTSEKRDTNIDVLKPIVHEQAKDVAKFSTRETMSFYDRGTNWTTQQLDVKGEQWKAAYLPVWLYSYLQIKGNKKILHYVAVNARTKETMGSVPIHMPLLFFISAIVEILGIIVMCMLDDFDFNWIFLLSGFVYFFIIYSKYRNSDARHSYELETKNETSNLRQVDDFFESRTKLSSSSIDGRNDHSLSGETAKNNIINNIMKGQ